MRRSKGAVNTGNYTSQGILKGVDCNKNKRWVQRPVMRGGVWIKQWILCVEAPPSERAND